LLVNPASTHCAPHVSATLLCYLAQPTVIFQLGYSTVVAAYEMNRRVTAEDVSLYRISKSRFSNILVLQASDCLTLTQLLGYKVPSINIMERVKGRKQLSIFNRLVC
jgi:hypothetical protein